MADNLLIVISGGNATVRTTDRSGVHSQVARLDISQGSDAELLGLGDTKPLTVTSAGLTVASTNYAAGDQMGTEITLASAVRTGKGLIIQSAVLVDYKKVCSNIDLLIFDAATTPASDNAASAWSDADKAKLLGRVHFGDQYQDANNYDLQALNLPVACKPASGTSLYFDFVARAATGYFDAVTDMVVKLGCSVD